MVVTLPLRTQNEENGEGQQVGDKNSRQGDEEVQWSDEEPPDERERVLVEGTSTADEDSLGETDIEKGGSDRLTEGTIISCVTGLGDEDAAIF